MKSIYASKLYKASPRKERIKAAIEAAANLSLIQQLAEDLDDEYQTSQNLQGAEPVNNDKSDEKSDLFVDEEINPETDLVTMDDLGGKQSSKPAKQTPKPASSGPRKKASSDDLMPESPANDKNAGVNSEQPAESKPEEPAEASTKIMSSEDINLSVMKESLNARQDTAGVARIIEKDDEIWIYYKDELNLNNLMDKTIEYLTNAGYVNLEFNRLARSDNAIVFQKLSNVSGLVNTIE